MKTLDQLRAESIQADIAFMDSQKAVKAVMSDSMTDTVEKARLWKASEEAFNASCVAWKALHEAYDAELDRPSY